METLIALITIIAAILQIILFFKVWGMTNDVRKLREMAGMHFQNKVFKQDKQLKNAEEPQTSTSANINMNISEGEYVIRKSTGQRMQVESINGNKVFCNTGKLGGYKYFSFDEIEKEP